MAEQFTSKCSWLTLLYSLQTALSTFQVISYTAAEVWQTRHQLRIFCLHFSAGKTLADDCWGCLPPEEQHGEFSSPPPCQLTPSPSSVSRCAATLCWVFQAFPLFQRGKYWMRWGDPARKAWFSLEFLCTSQLLFSYVIKSLQEARPV